MPRNSTPRTTGRAGLAAVIAGLTLAVLVAPVGPVPVPAAAGAEADTSFTIAQVPDTQEEVLSDSDPLLAERYRWLAANKDALNLRYLAHSGDSVNWGVADPAQFGRAAAATRVLDDAGIRYGHAIGNHDTAAVQVGGSAAAGNVRDNLRDTRLFNQTFPVSGYRDVGGVFEPGKVDNMFQTFRAGGLDWLVLTHEMWPRQAVLDWAKQVLREHPRHNVVINTHAYLNNRGERPTTGNYGDQNAQAEWDQLISQYPNVRLVLSGHYGPKDGFPGYHYAEATGVHGNKIAQVMTAYHAPFQNHTRLLRIDTVQQTISSTVHVASSTRAGYPSGWITDGASNFVATEMNWIAPEQASGEPVPAPQPAVPGAPREVTAVAGERSAEVSFGAPESDGGAPVTGYTVTASPGGQTVSGARGPLTVPGLSAGTAYTFRVTAANGAGAGPPSEASASVLPWAELLPDAGFEAGNGGWIPFAVGELSRVSTPARGGRTALRVAATSGETNLVGLTQNSVLPNSVAGRQYTAQCYVRPAGAGLKVQIRFLEYTQNYSSNVKLGTTVAQNLPANTWTLLRVSAAATSSGKRIIPQIYSTNQTTATAAIAYDDCSVRSG